MDPTNPGLFTQMATALQTPFGTTMSWSQLAAVVVFIFIVALAWRQVVLFIGQEL
jgi:hypothetical protein